MTVDPATGLVDGDRVTITASGLPPGSWVEAGQCVSAPVDAYRDCDVSDGAFAIVGADGTATMALRVDAVLTAGFGAGTSREVDCRQEACTVALWGDAATPLVSNALGFVADAPLAPPPTLSVTPDTGLHDHHLRCSRGHLPQCGRAGVAYRNLRKSTILPGVEVCWAPDRAPPCRCGLRSSSSTEG